MKTETSLYFDIYRKANFDKLIKVFTSATAKNDKKENLRENLGTFLELYLGTAETYDGSQRKWQTAYIPGLELGVFSENKEKKAYELSPLAKSLLASEITSSEYLTIYFLNFIQVINGEIVSPLKEVLLLLQEKTTIDKEDIKNIEKFNLTERTEKNKNQISNILLTRLVNANILEIVDSRRGNQKYSISKKYSVEDLLNSIPIFKGNISNYEAMTRKEFNNLLSKPNRLISKYQK